MAAKFFGFRQNFPHFSDSSATNILPPTQQITLHSNVTPSLSVRYQISETTCKLIGRDPPNLQTSKPPNLHLIGLLKLSENTRTYAERPPILITISIIVSNCSVHKVRLVQEHSENLYTMFSQAEVARILADRDRRHDEEKANRESKMAKYDLYFEQLYTMLHLPKPTMLAQTNNSGSDQGVLGNLPTIQAQPNNFGAEQVVAGHLPTFEGLPFSTQPSHGGSFQALLSQAPPRNNEIAREGDEWWGNLPSN